MGRYQMPIGKKLRHNSRPWSLFFFFASKFQASGEEIDSSNKGKTKFL